MPALLPFYFLRFVGSLANQFLVFAVPLLVYGLTGSVAYSGLAFFVEWLPRLLSFPIAGAAADRYGPKPVYMVADTVRLAASVATVAGLALLPEQGPLFLIALAMVAGFFFEQAFISVEKIARKLAPPERMHKVQSMLTGIDHVTELAGPALAGLTAALVDVRALIAVTAGVFLVSLVVLAVVRGDALRPEPDRDARSLAAELRIGLRTLLGIRRLVLLVLLTNLMNFYFGLVLIVGPVMTTGVFDRPESHMGIVYTAGGVAGVVAVFASPWLADRLPIDRIGIAAFAVASAAFVAVGLAPTFPAYVVAVALVMAMDGVFSVFIRTERARLVPADRFGSTVGLIVLLNFVPMPLAGLVVAVAGDAVAIQTILIAAGVLSIVLSLPLIRGLLSDAATPAVEEPAPR